MYFHDPEKRPFKETAPGVRLRSFWGENITMTLVKLDEFYPVREDFKY